MIFTTGVFALFFALVLPLYWVLPPRARKYLLIVAGMVFYAYYYVPYLVVVLVMTILTYIAALAILKARDGAGSSKGRARVWLFVGVAASVLVLGYFKYWKMLVSTWNELASRIHMGHPAPVPDILVPMAISFFTFEFIHFVSDVYLGKIDRETVKVPDFALFIFFFPTLVSGPIKRYQGFQKQSQSMPEFALDNLLGGGKRVILGLAQKFILADTIGRLAAPLAAPEAWSAQMLAFAAYAYAFKIYFDFAGYSDMAIGLAQMLGFKVPENFDRPYFQPNIAQFWRHWHMSLSSWIRDYLYIPLGGSRLGFARTLANLIAAFAICGLWHGAAWNFVAWGLWHGFGMVGHRIWHRYLGQRLARFGTPVHFFNVFLTFNFVVAGWVLFASPSLSAAALTYAKLAGACARLIGL